MVDEGSSDYFYYAVGQWSKFGEVLAEGVQVSETSPSNTSSITFTPKPWTLPSQYGARYGTWII